MKLQGSHKPLKVYVSAFEREYEELPRNLIYRLLKVSP